MNSELIHTVARCSAFGLLIFLWVFAIPSTTCNAESLPDTLTELWSRRAEDVGPNKTQHVKTLIEMLTPRSDEPANIRSRFLLIEAHYFYGEFIAATPEEKRQYFDTARALSEVAFLVLAEKGGRPVSVFTLPAAEQATLFASDPDAAETYFWGAITWGLFGMSHSMLASAKQDVAGKIRRYAEVLIALNPNFLAGAGYRLLGRLHALTPRVPLFSMWINRAEAIGLLKKALSISNEDPRNAFFLSEALLDHDPAQRDYALELLTEVTTRRPRQQFQVEDWQTITQAQQRLARERRNEH